MRGGGCAVPAASEGRPHDRTRERLDRSETVLFCCPFYRLLQLFPVRVCVSLSRSVGTSVRVARPVVSMYPPTLSSRTYLPPRIFVVYLMSDGLLM